MTTMDDNERAAYWQGAFERMAARNYELSEANAEMLKALKKADQFISNGIEFGYISMPDPSTPDSAHDTPPMIRSAISKASPSLKESQS